MTSQNWRRLAIRLDKTLGLQHPPIAITFSQEAPEGVKRYPGPTPPPTEDGRTGKVSAGCVFWIKSERRTFTTAPEDHYNCSVGSITHGLKTLEEVMENGDVQSILECEWVTPEEAMALPTVQERPEHITYGPLSDTPIDPDVILLRVNPFQGMLIKDAFSEARLEGKPQCHIVPLAKEQNEVSLSTGCMLSRIRTGMAPTEMTCTIPAGRLDEAVKKLEARQKANAAVANYANQDRRRFSETTK